MIPDLDDQPYFPKLRQISPWLCMIKNKRLVIISPKILGPLVACLCCKAHKG